MSVDPRPRQPAALADRKAREFLRKADPVLAGVIDAHPAGATPAQVGLAWLLAHDPHILLMPGTSNVEHLVENVATADVRLDATMAVLDGLAAAGGRGC